EVTRRPHRHEHHIPITVQLGTLLPQDHVLHDHRVQIPRLGQLLDLGALGRGVDRHDHAVGGGVGEDETIRHGGTDGGLLGHPVGHPPGQGGGLGCAGIRCGGHRCVSTAEDIPTPRRPVHISLLLHSTLTPHDTHHTSIAYGGK